MKEMDNDAKQKIRDYIDSIDEYMKENTHLHPNEIDSLLTEINDFIYLRINEIASKEKIGIKDVLKAIEECGSPKEICEQYMDHGEDKETGKSSTNEIGVKDSSKKYRKTSKSSSSTIVSKKRKYKIFNIKKLISSFFSSLRSLDLFSFFRLTSILFYLLIIVPFLVFFKPFIGDQWDSWITAGWVDLVDPVEAHQLSWYAYNFFTACILCFIIIEGVFIDFWKSYKVRKHEFNRTNDDSIVLLFTRFGSLLFFLKCSILFNLDYILLIPIWVVLLLFFERKFRSKIWLDKISPVITSVGLRIEGKYNYEKREKNLLLKQSKVKEPSLLEKPLILTFLICFGSSFLWPLISIRTYFTGELILNRLPLEAFIFPYIFIIPVFGVLIYSISRRVYSTYIDTTKPLQREPNLLIWLVRLLTIKTIIIVVTYTIPSGYSFRIRGYNTDYYIGLILLIFLWLFFEIVISSYRPKTIRSRIAKIFLMISGTDHSEITSVTISSQPLVVAEVVPSLLKSKKEIYLPQTDIVNHHRGLRSFFGYVLEAITSATLLFVIIFYQVFLISILITTWSSESYIYYSTVFAIILHFWYIFILLGFQLFALASVGFYRVITGETEGIVIKFVRTISRGFLVVLIAILTLASETIMLIITIGLLSFNEVTAWKIRIERKKIELVTDQKEILGSQDEVNRFRTNKTLNKIEKYL